MSSYQVRRILRHRLIWLPLYGLPAAVALARAVSQSSSILLAVRACPFVCAGLVCALVCAVRAADRASGLELGLRGTPLSDSGRTASFVAAAAALFLSEMALFAFLLGIVC